MNYISVVISPICWRFVFPTFPKHLGWFVNSSVSPAGHCGFAKVDCKPLQGACRSALFSSIMWLAGLVFCTSSCWMGFQHQLLRLWTIYDMGIQVTSDKWLLGIGIAGFCFQTIQHTLGMIIANDGNRYYCNQPIYWMTEGLNTAQMTLRPGYLGEYPKMALLQHNIKTD